MKRTSRTTTVRTPSPRTATASGRHRRRTPTRRLLAAFGSVFVLAASSLVYGLTSSPAGAHDIHSLPEASNPYNPAAPWPPTNNALWSRPAPNPPIGDSCGIDVGIIVDRSGSIADAGAQTTMRNSAKSIVTLLAGTPSRVGVWSFAEDSSATGTAEYPARQLTDVGGPTGPAGVTALHATIDSIPIVSQRSTNWEAGFKAAHSATVATGNAPDLVFILTDGKPTVHYDDPASGGTTNNDDVDGGIAGANLVKSDGTRVFGVGIGAGIDATTIGLVANPEEFTGDNITTAGYALTDFAHLEADLRALVTSLCGGSITVQKLVDNGSGQFTAGAGWGFTVDPTNAALPNQNGTTDASGDLNIKVDSAQTEQVTVTETPQAAYRFLGGVTCTNSNGPNPSLTTVTNGVRFDLSPTAIISCTFKNQLKTVDLSIAKTDGGISAHPGDDVTYTLTYGNAGNADAPNTVLTETVPANATVDLGTGPADGTNDGWVCNASQSGVWPAGTTCTRAVGTVAAGASGLTVPFTVTVDNPFPALVTHIANTATVAYDNSAGADTNPANNTATDTTPILTNAQLVVIKTVAGPGGVCATATDATTIVAGQSVTYCYVVSNPGDSAARNVTLVDDNGTPANSADDFGVTLTGLTDQDGGGVANDLAAKASAVGQASRSFAAAGTVLNTATATAVGLHDNDTATVTVTRPGLTIVKTAITGAGTCPGTDNAVLFVNELDPVRFCYVVTNPGTADLLNVSVLDDNGTPANPADDFGVTLTGLADLDGGGAANDLAAGATATGTAGPVSAHAGSVTNTATASGSSLSGESFTDADTATVQTNDTIPPIVVTKDHGGGSVTAPGADVTYTVTVHNTGNEDVTITSMTDAIDGGTPFTIATPATAPVLATTCALGTVVAPNATYTCTFTLHVSGAGGESVHDVVAVSAVDNEQNTTTDTDDDTTPVTPVVDLGIVKTDGGISAHPGDNVTYTLTYGNAGPTAAPNTVLSEVVPTNTTFDLGTGPADGKNDGWVCNASQSGVWPAGTTCTRAVGTVAGGASGLTVTFTVTVDTPFPPLVSQIVNTTIIGYDDSNGPDVDPTDNTSTDTTPVLVTPQLTIVKTVAGPGGDCATATDATTIVAGQSVLYCYVVSNPGDTAARNVTLVDDNGTPGNTADDFAVALTGLTDEDGGGATNDLAAGATATGQAPETFASPGTVVNTATAAAVGLQGSDTATVTVTRPGLTIVKTAIEAEDGQTCPGIDGVTLNVDEEHLVRYCYVITNPGDAPLLDLAVLDDDGSPADPTDDFMVYLTGLADLDSDGFADDLAPGATATGISAPLDLPAGTVTNTATATGFSAADEQFIAADDATVESADTIPPIDVTKDDGGVSVAAPGGDVAYTVTVHNTGDEPVTITEMTDSIEGGTPFTIATPATAPVLATTCALGTQIDPDATYTCTFTVHVSGSGGENVADLVSVTAVDDENTPTTDTAPETTPVTPVADVGVVKSIDKSSLTVGQPGVYTLEVTNHGPSTATDVVVTDTVPTGLTVQTVTPPAGWTCSGNTTITCTTASLANGASATITISVLVGADAVPEVTNVVDVTATEPDYEPTNNHDEVTTPVLEPTTTTTAAPTTTAGVAPAEVAAPLPTTGSDALRLGGAGLLLVAAGALVLAIRHRRAADASA